MNPQRLLFQFVNFHPSAGFHEGPQLGFEGHDIQNGARGIVPTATTIILWRWSPNDGRLVTVDLQFGMKRRVDDWFDVIPRRRAIEGGKVRHHQTHLDGPRCLLIPSHVQR